MSRRQKARQRQQERQKGRIQTPGFGGPQDLINQAQQANIQTAQTQQNMNALNEFGPYGSSEYIRDAAGNITGRRTSLSPDQQAILNNQQSLEQGLQHQQSRALGNYNAAPALNFNGLPQATPITSSQFDGSQYQTGQFAAQGLQNIDIANDSTRQRVEDAYFNRQRRLLDQNFADQSESTTANLRARGYQFGGDDYNEIYRKQVTDPRNRAMQDAADAAVMAGGQEQQRMFGMQSQLRGQQFGEQLSSAQQNMGVNAQNFGQSLAGAQQNMAVNAQNFGQNMASRQQGIQEQLTMRNQPLQEAATIAGMQRGVINPNVQAYTPTQVQGVDVGGIGMGFANMANERFMQQQDQAFQRSLPRGGGGGGMDPNEWYRRQLFTHMLGQENMMLQNQFGGGGGSSPSPWAMLGAGLASGVGQGLGQGMAGAF